MKNHDHNLCLPSVYGLRDLFCYSEGNKTIVLNTTKAHICSCASSFWLCEAFQGMIGDVHAKPHPLLVWTSGIPVSLVLVLTGCSGSSLWKRLCCCNLGSKSVKITTDAYVYRDPECYIMINGSLPVRHQYLIFQFLQCPLPKVNIVYWLLRIAVMTLKREIVSSDLNM